MQQRQQIKTIQTVFLLLCGVLLATQASAQIKVTELYEVGQGNVALTTHLSLRGSDSDRGNLGEWRQGSAPTLTITNQYTYAPYGAQNNLNHPISPLPRAGEGSGERALLNQTRKPLNITHNQFSYTGQAADPSTNLMMLGGFRNYAPGIGQFIQPDSYNSFSNVSIYNKYAYVDNNPLSSTDPSGHFAWNPLSDVMNGLGLAGSIGDILAAGNPALGIGVGVLGAISAGAGLYASGERSQTASYISMGAGALASLGSIPLALLNPGTDVSRMMAVAGGMVGAGANVAGLGVAFTGQNSQAAAILGDAGFILAAGSIIGGHFAGRRLTDEQYAIKAYTQRINNCRFVAGHKIVNVLTGNRAERLAFNSLSKGTEMPDLTPYGLDSFELNHDMDTIGIFQSAPDQFFPGDSKIAYAFNNGKGHIFAVYQNDQGKILALNQKGEQFKSIEALLQEMKFSEGDTPKITGYHLQQEEIPETLQGWVKQNGASFRGAQSDGSFVDVASRPLLRE